MSEVARLARFRIDPARRQELFDAYVEYAETVRAERGVQTWELCTSADDPNEIWIYVRAADAAALDAHRSSDAVATLGELLMPSIVGSPEFHDLIPAFSNRT